MPPTAPVSDTPRRSARNAPRAHAPTSLTRALSFELGGVAVDVTNPKWIQVCKTGRFKGYRSGAEFDINEEVFARMVANFRAHPSYVAGADKLPPEEAGAKVLSGALGVIPFDIDHVGGPAEAWGLEMEARPDGAGGFGLWLYTHFLEPAYTWMRESRFKWTSITWEENATDPVSGAKIGPYVMSVALTNDPFVQGMRAIQNARITGDRGAVARAFPHLFSWDPWSPPRSATELLCALRRLLGLPEIATLEAVLAGVASLRTWSSGELPAPVGVDVDELVGELRLLLNLPTLSDPASIFAELDKLLGAVAAEEREEEQETTMPTPAAAPAADPTQAARPSQIVTHFAKALSVEETEPAVLVALERRFTAGSDALALVDALSKALKVSDPKELSGKVAELVAIKQRMDELVPEMAAQEAAAEEEAGALADQDVGAVMATRGLGEELRAALSLQRRGGSADYFKSLPPRERAAKRAAARADFLRHYEVATLDVPPEYRHLYGRTLFAGPGAVFSGLGAHPAPAGGGPAGARSFAGAQGAPPPAPPPRAGHAPLVTWADVNEHEGRNDAERVFAFVKAQDPKLAYEAAWTRANALRSELISREGPSPS